MHFVPIKLAPISFKWFIFFILHSDRQANRKTNDNIQNSEREKQTKRPEKNNKK